MGPTRNEPFDEIPVIGLDPLAPEKLLSLSSFFEIFGWKGIGIATGKQMAFQNPDEPNDPVVFLQTSQSPIQFFTYFRLQPLIQ